MNQRPAIEVRDLSKMYHIGALQSDDASLPATIAAALTAPLRRARSMVQNQLPEFADETLWALRDISFDVARGEVVGVIGRNGAGKSTLLKILTGISAPTEGYAKIYGRVGSLLEVGTGFHPELTGRDNIYMNGSMLGMSRREIAARFDEIVAFSGVERFIDTPIKRYSSGMQVRLAFSVAAHLDPEVLLVDEVLSVGDAEFRRKCVGKMRDVTGQGRTVVLVSHNMTSIQHLCDRVILLDGGRIAMMGEPDAVISRYLMTETTYTSADLDLHAHPNRHHRSVQPVLQRVRLLNAIGDPSDSVMVGDEMTIELTLDSEDTVYEHAVAAINIYDDEQRLVSKLVSRLDLGGGFALHGQQVVRCHWPECILSAGEYTLGLYLWSYRQTDDSGNTIIDRVTPAITFTVVSGDFYGTGEMVPGDKVTFLTRGQWQVESLAVTPQGEDLP